MLWTPRISIPSLTGAGVAALVIGAYNLLAVTIHAITSANRFASLPGYTFSSMLARSWSAYLQMDGAGIAVPAAVGAALLLLSRSEVGSARTDAGGGRVRTVLTVAVSVAGVLCWLPPVGLAVLGVVRLVLGGVPAPWSSPFYLALVVGGGVLFALGGVLNPSPGRMSGGDPNVARPDP